MGNLMRLLTQEEQDKIDRDYLNSTQKLAEAIFIHRKDSLYWDSRGSNIRNVYGDNLATKAMIVDDFLKNQKVPIDIEKIKRNIYYLCVKQRYTDQQIIDLHIDTLDIQSLIGVLNQLFNKTVNLESTSGKKFIDKYKATLNKINSIIVGETELQIDKIIQEIHNYRDAFVTDISEVKGINQNHNIKLNYSKLEEYIKSLESKKSSLNGTDLKNISTYIQKELDRQFYYKYSLLTKQLGFAFEKQVKEFLDLSLNDLVLIADKDKFQVNLTGAQKVAGISGHSRTRKRDMEITVPEIDIKDNEISYGSKIATTGFSIKRPQGESSSVHFHSASNLENMISFLQDNIVPASENTKTIQDTLQVLKEDEFYSYFLANDYYMTRSTVGTKYLRGLQKLLMSFGPIYALSTFTDYIDDNIDMVIINNKIIPAGVLYNTYLDLINKEKRKMLFRIKIYSKEKPDLKDLQGQTEKKNNKNFKFYDDNYLALKKKERIDYLDSISFSAEMTGDFRAAINNYIETCIQKSPKI